VTSQNINSICDNPDSVREVFSVLLLYNSKGRKQWDAECRLFSNGYIGYWKKFPPV